MYSVCKTLENNVCTEWVAVSPFGLPPLSVQDAVTIGGAIVLTWAIAFGFVVVGRMLSKR